MYEPMGWEQIFQGLLKVLNCCLTLLAYMSVWFASTVFLFMYSHLSVLPPLSPHGIYAFCVLLSIKGTAFNAKLIANCRCPVSASENK